MDLNRFPPSVLSGVLGHLIQGKEFKPRMIKIGARLRNIRAARLVCRQWNALATPHLFETVSLIHSDKDSDEISDYNFPEWNGLLDNDAIRASARRVVIQSSPKNVEGSGAGWFRWNEGEAYPAFTDAIARIAEMPNLVALEIHFSDKARGRQSEEEYAYEEVEYSRTRVNTLKAVFGAIRERAAKNPGWPTIRSLALKDLQNIPIPEFTDFELYWDVMKDVERLHMMVTEEYNEHGPDRDVYMIERQQYEPHLQNSLLPPLADQLTNLTLSFGEEWGVVPGYFDGRGLVFPRLKTLTLGDFIIGYHDHFDWVLAQKTLTTLRLDACHIVSHLHIDSEEMDTWNVRTDDWELQPRGSYGFVDDRGRVYTFPGTWAAVLDRIRTELPNLTDFRFDKHMFGLMFLWWNEMGARLPEGRYITFDAGMLPTPWIEPNSLGELEFGDGIAAPWVPGENDESRDDPEAIVNPARETEVEDRAALEALLETVRKRCRDLQT